MFSVGTISWALLLAGLTLLCATALAPAMQDRRAAEVQRNNLQATLDLLDQKIALQQEFMKAATKDPLLMERLAARQLNLNRPGEEVIVLDREARFRDHSISTLLAESLTPVTPQPVAALPWYFAALLQPGIRPLVVLGGCAALVLSFFLGVRYERS